MFRRFFTLAPWKRRLLALVAGLALGAGITAAYVFFAYANLRAFPATYAAAHRSGDVEKVAALFCWDGVPAAERGRIKLDLKQEMDLPLKDFHLARLGPGDGEPHETLEGRRVPNLKPECRLVASFGDTRGTGIKGWLVGKSAAGYRIVVYRPETPRAN